MVNMRLIALLCMLLFMAACGMPDPEILPDDPTPVPSPVEPLPPVPEPNITYVKKPAFSPKEAYAQSAQLAMDLVRVFALGSGLGEPMNLSNKTIETIQEKLDIIRQPTKGYWASRRVYAAGSPKLRPEAKNTLYPTDWESWRWLLASVDRSTSLDAATATITAALFAAEVLDESVNVADHYDGLLLSAIATVQMEHLNYNAKSGNFYADLDADGATIDAFSFTNQARVLGAMSRIATFADHDAYAGTIRRSAAIGYANQLFNTLLATHKRNVSVYAGLTPAELRTTIEAYAVFAAVTDSEKWQLLAFSHIRLASAQLQLRVVSVEGAELLDLAATVEALAYAYRVTDDPLYLEGAKTAWQQMERQWDTEGFYTVAQHRYTPAMLAQLFRSINAAAHVLDLDVAERFAALYTNTVVLSGLTTAEYRSEIASIPDASETLRAPAFVSAVQYDPKTKTWSIADGSFRTAEAMALAAALLQGSENGQGEYRVEDFGMPKPTEVAAPDSDEG